MDELEAIMLSETRQSQKDTYCLTPLTQCLEQSDSETKQNGGWGGTGAGAGEGTKSGVMFSCVTVLQDEKVLEIYFTTV